MLITIVYRQSDVNSNISLAVQEYATNHEAIYYYGRELVG